MITIKRQNLGFNVAYGAALWSVHEARGLANVASGAALWSVHRRRRY